MANYTFEITNAPYAIDHALHCLSMRPDDFVEYGRTTRSDAPSVIKSSIQHDKDLSFVLAYYDGHLVNNVFVKGLSEGGDINILHGLSAPQNGSLAYIYGSIYLEVMRFFASEGYSTYSTSYFIGHNAHKLYTYYSETFTEYNFDFQDGSVDGLGNLVVDLVNLRGDT